MIFQSKQSIWNQKNMSLQETIHIYIYMIRLKMYLWMKRKLIVGFISCFLFTIYNENLVDITHKEFGWGTQGKKRRRKESEGRVCECALSTCQTDWTSTGQKSTYQNKRKDKRNYWCVFSFSFSFSWCVFSWWGKWKLCFSLKDFKISDYNIQRFRLRFASIWTSVLASM